MRDARRNPSLPDWSCDRQDSIESPNTEPAHFDRELNGWVFSRHEDVLAALRSSALAVVGSTSTSAPAPVQQTAMARMRDETLEALSPEQLRVWSNGIRPEIDRLVSSLPSESAVDLYGRYGVPACFAAATLITEITEEDAQPLRRAARVVSDAAAEPFSRLLRYRARFATKRLEKPFHSSCETLRGSGFVALSQTMPRLLANSWHALLKDSTQWELLHNRPELVEQAIEELLRAAGLTRVLFRIALNDVELSGCRIRQGERVLLRVIAANHDPERFSCPHQTDITAYRGGQLTLGSGPHACVGASLIRMIASALTRPLVERFASARLAAPARWQGGSGFRSPTALRVVLVRAENSVSK